MSLGATETTWPQEPTLVAGDFRSTKSFTLLSGEGALGRSTVLARDEASNKLVALDRETDVVAEVVQAASKTAASVAAEVLAAGDGSKVEFHTFSANTPIVPGSIDGDATVGAAGKTFTDDGAGKISGDSGNIEGHVDYDSGYIFLQFATAPDNSTNVTTDYDHGSDKKVFTKTLANTPVIPRTVTVDATISAAGVEATDDGHGTISGTGVSGTIDYETGALSVTYTTAPDDPSNVTVDYSYGDADNKHVPVAILAEDADSTSGDVTITAYQVGEFRSADLTWPASITAGNQERATEQLEAQGAIIK